MQIIVLGMHRSGTSAVVRLLHTMGCHVGARNDLLPALACNPEGFWERQDVRDINEALLGALDATWYNPTGADIQHLSAKARHAFTCAAAPVIETLNQHPLWVMKDPRLSLFLPEWMPLLDRPLVVLCWRHPIEVALSLQRRDGFPLFYGLALWEWYTISALRVTSGMPCHHLSYNALMSDPAAATARLHAACVELGVEALQGLTTEQVDSVITPDLRHGCTDSASEAHHLSLAQQRLFAWLENPRGASPARVSGGSQAILAETRRRDDDLTAAHQRTAAANQRAAAANEGRARAGTRALQAMRTADGLSDGVDILLSSWSWKVGRQVGRAARCLRPKKTDTPETFLARTGREYRQWKLTRDLHVIALIAAYNDEGRIRACLEHLINQGVEVFLLDNESTDRTVDIAREYEGKGLIAIETLPRDDMFSLMPQLLRKEALAAELDADWFMHADTDEFRLPPSPSHRSLREAFAVIENQGFNAAEFMEYTFVATREHPEHDPATFLDTMQWYYPFQPFRPHRINAWKRCAEPVDLHSSGGHQVQFPGRHVYPGYFILKHYTYLSRALAIEKFVTTTFDPAEDDMHGWRHALREEDVVLPSEDELRRFTDNDHLDASDPRTCRFIAEGWHRREDDS